MDVAQDSQLGHAMHLALPKCLAAIEASRGVLHRRHAALSTVTLGLPPVFAENLKKNLRLLGKEAWRLAQT